MPKIHTKQNYSSVEYSLTPKQTTRFYEYLCQDCRYDWVYNEGTNFIHCSMCGDSRFAFDIDINVLFIDTIYEHTKTNSWTMTFEQESNVGSGLIILIPTRPNIVVCHPTPKETFESYLARTRILFGRMMTPKKFITLNVVQLDDHISYTNYYFRRSTPRS